MLRLFLLLLASMGPGLLWLWYFYRQDRFEPEPIKEIIKVFLIGVLLVIPAGLIEQIWRRPLMVSLQASDWVTLLVMAFLVIALVEEGLKAFFLWRMVGNNRELNEPVDGIIYGITLGLGFASLENLLWVSVFGFGVAIMRGIVTTLAHASFTGWMGYFIAKYKLPPGGSNRILWIGFLVPWLSHGAYDFFLFLRSPIASAVAFMLILGLLIGLYRTIQKQVANSPFKS